jgi:hypothetical protein
LRDSFSVAPNAASMAKFFCMTAQYQ